MWLDGGYDEPDSSERPGADARANELFGWTGTPEAKSWHKAGDGRTVLLVDAELHDEFDSDDRAEGKAGKPQQNLDDAADSHSESGADDQTSTDAADRQDAENDDDSIGGVDAAASLVVRGDAGLAGLSFDPSRRRDELGDCFRPGAYDVHQVLDHLPPDQASDLVRTVQRAADLGARVDLREEPPVLAVRWDARDAATFTDGDSLAAFLERRSVAEDRNSPESSVPASAADTSVEVGAGVEDGPWTDPELRRSWVEERLADPKHTKAVTSDEPWARYQRARVGDVEVELETAEPGSTIWADGLEIDPDTVVVVEVKYVMRPDRSLYEGKVPARMLEVMLHPFDDEMERYASVVQHSANPVERIRLVTSTDAAARFLGERARRIVGEGIDLDVQVWSEEER